MTDILALVLDSTSFFLVLLLVALGLVIIFGLMNVINMAHGEFFLIGAYTAVSVTRAGWPFWWALLLAPLVLAGVGWIVEQAVVRFVYRRFIDSILATWGLSLMLKQLIVIIFGPRSQSVADPLATTVNLLGMAYPGYRLFVMAASIALTALTFVLLYRTHIGLTIRGVIANRAMAASLGINTRRLDVSTFMAGAALAGFAGAVMAPLMSVDPQMGAGFLIPSFLSILVGGTGSFLGVVIGAGLISSGSTGLSALRDPVFAQVVVFSLAIVIIRLFPNGLFGRRSR
ncbi:LIV-I protein H [Variovorax sp. PBS-H4]|uniref:branched-chain amino acid ABC transporter permease n=1 Tax=Variovorax sp. PBS-H4 TaxID=434008 RepID=UPI0013171286|nr:branched-chain amino acid ABC transporter permease [Variovorax sp. PBS-H4]VTU39926.1 LIV-I protein H [Variovorax sp. PBS-H4]